MKGAASPHHVFSSPVNYSSVVAKTAIPSTTPPGFPSLLFQCKCTPVLTRSENIRNNNNNNKPITYSVTSRSGTKPTESEQVGRAGVPQQRGPGMPPEIAPRTKNASFPSVSLLPDSGQAFSGAERSERYSPTEVTGIPYPGLTCWCWKVRVWPLAPFLRSTHSNR